MSNQIAPKPFMPDDDHPNGIPRGRKPYADMDYEERMAAWGATFTGASQDSGHRNPTSRSTDDGIKDQT